MRSHRGMLGVLMVAAVIAACTEEAPTSSGATSDLAPATTLAEDGTIAGRLVTTVRRFDGKELLGTVTLVDTAIFEGALRRGEVRVAATSQGQRFFLSVAMTGSTRPGAPVGRRHEWTARAPEGVDRSIRVRTATFVREGEAPVSEMTYRRGAEVVARVTTTWVRVTGGWLMQSRTLTAFRDGRPVSSVETVVRDRRVAIGSGALSASSAATTDASGVGGALRERGEGVASEAGDCEKEFDNMFDALDRYWFASTTMVACLGGPLACFASSMAVMLAARGVDVAESRLDRCLGGAQ